MKKIDLAAVFGAAFLAAIPAGGAFAGPAAPAPAPQVTAEVCPAQALSLSGSLTCICPAGSPTGSIWGTGTYTADSDICVAARHSGAIGEAGGGVVVTMLPGQDAYVASTAYGIVSNSWPQYTSSFMVQASAAPVSLPSCTRMPDGVEVLDCQCPSDTGAGGSAWGSGPYTADSDLCTAARHAGVLGPQGGEVRALAAPGLPGYRGSFANGVETMGYGSYDASVDFDRN